MAPATLVDLLRGLLDMTPAGRGDFFPKVIAVKRGTKG
jgi:hypothetical protein